MTVAVKTVLTEPLEVRRTRKVWPDEIAPDVAHAPPLTLICAVAAPVTETEYGVVQPEKVIVAVLLVTTVFKVSLLTLVKDNPLGALQALVVEPMVSQVVPSQYSITPPVYWIMPA